MNGHLDIQTAGYHSKLFTEMHKLQKQGVACDVTVSAEDGEIAAHRIILISASKYFRCRIMSNLKEKNLKIHLQGVTIAELANIIKYVYTGKLFVAEDSVDITLEICEMLELNDVIKGYKDILVKKPPGEESKTKCFYSGKVTKPMCTCMTQDRTQGCSMHGFVKENKLSKKISIGSAVIDLSQEDETDTVKTDSQENDVVVLSDEDEKVFVKSETEKADVIDLSIEDKMLTIIPRSDQHFGDTKLSFRQKDVSQVMDKTRISRLPNVLPYQNAGNTALSVQKVVRHKSGETTGLHCVTLPMDNQTSRQCLDHGVIIKPISSVFKSSIQSTYTHTHSALRHVTITSPSPSNVHRTNTPAPYGSLLRPHMLTLSHKGSPVFSKLVEKTEANSSKLLLNHSNHGPCLNMKHGNKSVRNVLASLSSNSVISTKVIRTPSVAGKSKFPQTCPVTKCKEEVVVPSPDNAVPLNLFRNISDKKEAINANPVNQNHVSTLTAIKTEPSYDDSLINKLPLFSRISEMNTSISEPFTSQEQQEEHARNLSQLKLQSTCSKKMTGCDGESAVEYLSLSRNNIETNQASMPKSPKHQSVKESFKKRKSRRTFSGYDNKLIVKLRKLSVGEIAHWCKIKTDSHCFSTDIIDHTKTTKTKECTSRAKSAKIAKTKRTQQELLRITRKYKKQLKMRTDENRQVKLKATLVAYSERKRYRCDKCHVRMGSKLKYMLHVKSKHECGRLGYQCPAKMCSFFSRYKWEFRIHNQLKHSSTEKTPCIYQCSLKSYNDNDNKACRRQVTLSSRCQGRADKHQFPDINQNSVTVDTSHSVDAPESDGGGNINKDVDCSLNTVQVKDGVMGECNSKNASCLANVHAPYEDSFLKCVGKKECRRNSISFSEFRHVEQEANVPTASVAMAAETCDLPDMRSNNVYYSHNRRPGRPRKRSLDINQPDSFFGNKVIQNYAKTLAPGYYIVPDMQALIRDNSSRLNIESPSY